MSNSIFADAINKIRTSLDNINSLDDAKFKRLLQRIAEKAGRQNETIFTLDELNKLETAFGLSLDDLKQLIEIFEYMFLQSAYHLIKLQALQNDLVNELNFTENKAKIFAEQWATHGKDIVERLKSSHVATHSLEDVRWTLDVGISQGSKSKVKRPIGICEFQLQNQQTQKIENIQTEFTKDELYAFFEEK